MSKYDQLWKYVLNSKKQSLTFTFAENRTFYRPLFLKYKKELTEYGYEASKN